MSGSKGLPGWGASDRAAAPRVVQAGATEAAERRRPASIYPREPGGQHEGDGWTLVGRAGKAPRVRDSGPAGNEALPQLVCASSADNNSGIPARRKSRPRSDFLDRELLAVGKDETLLSTIITALAQHWRQEPPVLTTIVALGLGSPTTSAPSRHQLALTVLLTARLGLKGAWLAL
jgi:hypothetical protein